MQKVVLPDNWTSDPVVRPCVLVLKPWLSR